MADAAVHTAFDVEAIRRDFPALSQQVHGKPLVYLDNAATSQKPRAVIDRLATYYERENSNIHRGVHHLSQSATDAFEQAREAVRRFVNAPAVDQLIFTRGTTEAINLVAQTFGRTRVGPGDEVVITTLEHHSNIVPWQMLCEEKGAVLRVVPITDDGEVRLDAFEQTLTDRTRLVAVCHVSNALGVINPVEQMIAAAHGRGIPVLIDGAQAVPHMRVDLEALDADFYCFSGHKMFGPTGIGVLYGRRELLEEMPPWQGGGDMIDEVTFERSTWNVIPHKFEAGTPHIAGGIGLGAAVEYLEKLDMDQLAAHERDVLEYATKRMQEVEGLRILARDASRASVVSFVMEDAHPYDTGTILDRMGIAIRTGHHCTQPLMARFGIPGTARASFAFYNTRAEVDQLVDGLQIVRSMFA
jgi:cysteine desulfurase / selenocysteine lyase